MAAATGLTDTDIRLDGARGLSEAVKFIGVLQTAGVLQISIISAMELVAGCRDTAQLQQVQRFLASVGVLPINEGISRAAYQLMESFYLRHGLALPDALIVATALEHGLWLYTKNERHFQMVPALVVVRPY